jgi:hypothetical protein
MSRFRHTERKRAKWLRALPRRARYDVLLTRWVARRQDARLGWYSAQLDRLLGLVEQAISIGKRACGLAGGTDEPR